VLVSHCEAIGRDPAEIERTASVGTIFIRDSAADAERVGRVAFERNCATEPWYPHYGSPEQIAEQLAPFVELGYRHLIANFPSPYDEESVTRFATQVRPLLEAA
jgi:alkanesulfonate monooxygenase SsuD/methylene tetrahydromethanopterin reductase-like flavin-dependent oxidoreductase (luciferase family)